VTQPDRPAGRGQRLQPTPVKAAALALGIPVIEPARLREAILRLAAERADLFAVASYGKIIPQAVLDLVPVALNVHPSLLPLYRGATPLQSQLLAGVTESGVTIIAMDAGMDTGDVVLAERQPIAAQETYGELHDRFARLGAALLARAVAQAASGSLVRTPQAQLGDASATRRTVTRPLVKDDLRVELAWEPERIARAVRAFAPQPLARARVAGEDVKLARARVMRGVEHARLLASATLGRFAASGVRDGEADGVISLSILAAEPQAIVVAGADASLVIDRVVPPSRGEMPAADYLRALIRRAGASPA